MGMYTALLALSAFVALVALTEANGNRVVCYLGSWATYRPSRGKFEIENIDPRLCDHLIYSFAGLNQTTNAIISLDTEYDINKEAFERFVNLKNINPDLKVSIAIGGWTEGSTKYSAMASNPTTRATFIRSVVEFINEHDFDGLDLDWEYPANRGGQPVDKENFVMLAKELRAEFEKHDWLLTAAVGAGKSTIDTAYDVKGLSEHVHYLHVMAYDYHGRWDGITGHNAPLYHRDDEAEETKALNVDFSIRYYLSLGCPPEKLVLGLGLYGRTFLLSDPKNVGMGAPAEPTAFAGPYTREDGFLGYNEICEKQKMEKGLWNVVWQKAHQAPYMFRENMWVSYDDDMSLKLKVAYAQRKKLAGVMVWSIDTDDFMGDCTGVKFPLMTTINKALHTDFADTLDTKDIEPGVPIPVKPEVTLDVDNDISVTRNSKTTGHRAAGSSFEPIVSLVVVMVAMLVFKH